MKDIAKVSMQVEQLELMRVGMTVGSSGMMREIPTVVN
jgi:hypothetical protein